MKEHIDPSRVTPTGRDHVTGVQQALTTEQIDAAIEECKLQCIFLADAKNYEPLSLRGILYKIGFVETQADEVIRDVASRGFEYCLDPKIECSNGDPDTPARVYPSSFATYWGPDQLRSRLDCLQERLPLVDVEPID